MMLRNDQFVQACEEGNVEAVKAFLQDPEIDINYIWPKRSHLFRSQLMFQHYNALSLACQGKTPNHREVVKLLLTDERINVNQDLHIFDSLTNRPLERTDLDCAVVIEIMKNLNMDNEVLGLFLRKAQPEKIFNKLSTQILHQLGIVITNYTIEQKSKLVLLTSYFIAKELLFRTTSSPGNPHHFMGRILPSPNGEGRGWNGRIKALIYCVINQHSYLFYRSELPIENFESLVETNISHGVVGAGGIAFSIAVSEYGHLHTMSAKDAASLRVLIGMAAYLVATKKREVTANSVTHAILECAIENKALNPESEEDAKTIVQFTEKGPKFFESIETNPKFNQLLKELVSTMYTEINFFQPLESSPSQQRKPGFFNKGLAEIPVGCQDFKPIRGCYM